MTIKSYNGVQGEFLYFKSNFEVIWNMEYFTVITSKICQDHKKMACLIMCKTLFLKYFQNCFFFFFLNVGIKPAKHLEENKSWYLTSPKACELDLHKAALAES